VILVVTPAAEDSIHGNGVTARRWAGILRDLGHSVEISDGYRGGDFTALLALHARKSAAAIRAFHADHPNAPIVIAMTGTDLYPSPREAGVDPEVLALATRFVVLQAHGVDQLGPEHAARTDVIIQSVPPIPPRPPRRDCFEVVFLAHIRPVKDPLRPAAAVRLLPDDSRIRVVHLGAARDGALAAEAAAESADNPRYDWLGPVARPEALAVLARSRLLVITSLHEGGANVVSEALAARVPIISSAIPGSIGLLGAEYPGYFPAGDTAALAGMLYAAERDRDGFYQALVDHCAALHPRVAPAAEKQAFAEMLKKLQLPDLAVEAGLGQFAEKRVAADLTLLVGHRIVQAVRTKVPPEAVKAVPGRGGPRAHDVEHAGTDLEPFFNDPLFRGGDAHRGLAALLEGDGAPRPMQQRGELVVDTVDQRPGRP
jgi:putative glycosyltransferase (TIGR04348 family)